MVSRQEKTADFIGESIETIAPIEGLSSLVLRIHDDRVHGDWVALALNNAVHCIKQSVSPRPRPCSLRLIASRPRTAVGTG
jgi:hypothetical protein